MFIRFVIAILVVISLLGQASAVEKSEDEGRRSAKEMSSDDAQHIDLGYAKLQTKTSNLIEEVFDVVRLKPVRRNVSMGMTSDGLNFRIDW